MTADDEGVRWEGDGTYTPTCALCEYEGKPQATRALAAQAVRAHRRAVAHRATARRRALQIMATGGRS